ncbi:MAG: 50S ribosome-binding GTPase [Armatimonadetes bacterium]|nr:50S ribosome-binding GTPase [Armatimonadota bacterium]
MSQELDLLLEVFPPESRQIVRDLWGALPADVRRELEATLGALHRLLGKSKLPASDLVSLMQRLATPALAPLSTVAIVGPVNVGKSTLYNCLVPEPKDHAEVSPIPGTTRDIQSVNLGLFALVDTPGADHGSPVGEQEKDRAMKAAAEADFMLIVFDAFKSVTASDRELYSELKRLGKPHLVVLNKIDLVDRRQRSKVVEAAATVLGLDPEEVVPTAAAHARGVERLVLEITAAEPRLLGKLGEMMVPLRRKLSWQAVRRSTIAAALIALTPIPLMDVIPLTAVQASMVLTVARIYGQEVSLARALELLTTFGAAWLARLAFQELSKLGGAPGWVISAAVAASATLAMGYASMRWFETGVKPTQKDLQQIARQSQTRLLETLKRLGRKKASRKSVTQELEDLMPELTEELEARESREPEGTPPNP